MKGLKVYLRGSGLRKAGDGILAIRDESPEVKKGEHYTIEEIVDGEGMCGRNLLIKLKGVEGLYTRKTFRGYNSKNQSN